MTTNVEMRKRPRFSILEIFLLCVLAAILCGFIFLGSWARRGPDSGLLQELPGAEQGARPQGEDMIDADSEHSSAFEAGSLAMTLPKSAGINPASVSTTSRETFFSPNPRNAPRPEPEQDSAAPPLPGVASGESPQAAAAPAGSAAAETAIGEAAATAPDAQRDRDIRAEVEAELRAIAAMEWGPEAEGKLKVVLELWASSDPSAALDYALRIESRRAGAAAANTVLTEWAKRDPEAAFDWYMQNRPGSPGKLDNAVGALFASMANASLESALDRLNKLPTDGLRNRALRAVISDQVAKGGAGRLELYFNGRGDAAALSMLAEAQIESIAAYKPEAAAAWIATLTDRYVRVKAVNTLIDKWGYDNPARAAQWVAGLPRDEYWGEFAGRMTRIWAREFPDSAASWLLSLSPPSEQLDAPIQALVSIVMKANPAGAMAWAEVITDLDRRNNLMQRAGYLWLRKDPDAAAAYILGSGLPDAVKKKLLGKSRAPGNRP